MKYPTPLPQPQCYVQIFVCASVTMKIPTNKRLFPMAHRNNILNIYFYFIAALVSVSEEVRSRCRVKHTFTSIIPDSPTFDNFAVDNHLKTAKRPNRYVKFSNSL